MWTLTVATFIQSGTGMHTLLKRDTPVAFKTRQEAENYMTEYVFSQPVSSLKFLGFLDSPYGMHDTLDPTFRFWLDHHLAI